MTLQDELLVMLEKARRYIKSAAVLQLEGDHDSAVSRLYYAMFYCAEALLLARGHSFSSHRAVISAFAQHFTYNKRDFSGVETFGIRVIDPRAFLQEIGELT